MTREEPHFLRRIMLMSSGLIIWAVHFTGIYGFNAVACARAFGGMELLGFGLVPVIVIALTLVALAATAGTLYAATRYDEGRSTPQEEFRFIRYVTLAVGWLSLVAIAWNGLPALLLSPCA